jgi:trimeric autotransporter adhesin
MKTSLHLNGITQRLLFALSACALCEFAQAVNPPPDGGYPGGNTAEGQNALFSLTTGGFNTAVGFFSLRSDTTGQLNTAIGAGALLANTSDSNTATGGGALLSNTTGHGNTANGALALFNNTGGNFNTATGVYALGSNTTGGSNTATGVNALVVNTTGHGNTAIGNGALFGNSTGFLNTAIGEIALEHNSTGNSNTALGFSAGSNVSTADHVICIGAGVSGANVSNSCFIGNIRGVATVNNDALPVLIDSAGQLGTTISSLRFKKEIQPMDKASEAILALNPVTFHYKSDKTNRPEFGLIAEEVAEVNPDLVGRGHNAEIYTVRYDAVNAMLLNEFLKEHRKNEEQEATIAELKLTAAQQQKSFESKLAKQEEQIEALTAGLRNVSAQLERSKLAPQIVSKD